MQEASEKGWFRVDGVIQLPSILAVAHDIAQGLAFLHKLDVAHGDLTGGNVLLAKDETTKTGLVAKVADFGLARNLDMASKIETRTYGTVTHMPPELLEKGIFTKASYPRYHQLNGWKCLTADTVPTKGLRTLPPWLQVIYLCQYYGPDPIYTDATWRLNQKDVSQHLAISNDNSPCPLCNWCR